MPNNSSDNLDEVNPSPLTALLKFLCPEDPDEAQHGYLDLQRRFTGFFEMKGMTDPVADATETLDRAGSKILEGVPIPDINRFCMGIAKNIVHERLRQRTRENKAFIHFVGENQNNESIIDKIENLLKPCFEKLPREERDVLKEYCDVPPGQSRSEHREQLAKRLNTKIEALRIRVMRLRKVLRECMKRLSRDQ